MSDRDWRDRDYGPDERYRIYAVRGDEDDPHLLATTGTPAGIGVAIVTLHEDAKRDGHRLADEGLIGILDGEAGEWIVLPWPRKES